MRKFVESLQDFEVVAEGTSIYVTTNEREYPEDEVKNYIVEQVKKTRCDMGYLGQKVHSRFPHFDCKDYEYSQFNKFVASIPSIQIYKVGNKIMVKENGNYKRRKK